MLRLRCQLNLGIISLFLFGLGACTTAGHRGDHHGQLPEVLGSLGSTEAHVAVGPSASSDAGLPEDAAPPISTKDASAPIEKMARLPAKVFRGKDPYETYKVNKYVSLPYPLDNIVRGLGRCRRGKRLHIAIDIGGVGPRWGLGTPVRSMAKAKVIRIGNAAKDPAKFGRLDQRGGFIVRRRRRFPRTLDVAGYGVVHFFTLDYGSWKAGNVVCTEALEGRLKGHRIRYMHLGAVHPGLKVGDIVQPGEEIGIMGCTAILNDYPHVHLDISNRRGRRVDPSPLLGLPSKSISCRRSKRALRKARARRRLAKRRRALRMKKIRRLRRQKAKAKSKRRKKGRSRVKAR